MDRKIEKIGLIPVITITNPEKDAEQIANILIDCNIPIAEVTYRTDRASDSIKIMKRFKKDLIVGAGTVLNIEQLDEAVNAGADFIVSPGMDEKLVEYAINNNIKIYPGCCTPSDIQKAVNLGIERIKFFPATQSGGVNTINSMCAPFGKIKVMATGGISIDNLSQYLNCKKVFACGASYLMDSKLIECGEWEKIKDNCIRSKAIADNCRSANNET